MNATLTGLAPATTYYYEAVATRRRRHDGRRDPQLRHHGGRPDATTQGASLIYANTTVALFANVNPDGSATNVSFVYGTSPTLSARHDDDRRSIDRQWDQQRRRRAAPCPA